MLSLFLNPYTMIAGGALVLAPIIIHLINRLRYRRVPWAAMEFLLASMKRNRRKMILRQLLLLLLRILIVALIGLLLARYLGATLGFGRPRGTVHVVILDDTASMGDMWREGGLQRNTFDAAKAAIVADIAAGAAEAATPQMFEVIRLSAPGEAPFHVERLSQQNLDDIAHYLNGIKCSALHAKFLPAVEAAKQIFERSPATKRVLHIVSDFRSRDWTSEAQALAKALPEAVGGDKTGGLHFLDAANPTRSANLKTVIDHGNIGIADLQPDARIVGKYLPVEFTLTMANFTPSNRKNVRTVVRVQGRVREDASLMILDLPRGISQHSFTATFDTLGPNTVTASIEPDEAGLAIDNLRYSTVEVREKVPLLFVTTNVAMRGKPEGEGFYLRALFMDAAKGFEVVERGPQELEQPTLDRYSAIYLLNVPRLSDKARANLEAYVRDGGGVFMAMGDAVDVDFYNSLHANGAGLFPAPISRPTDPLTDAQRFDRMFDPALPPKAFVRSDSHPIVTRLFREDRNREINTYLKFLFVERYTPVARARWNPQPGRTEELFTLPNYRPIDDYKEPAQRLLARLPLEETGNGKNPPDPRVRDRLREHARRVKEVLAANRPLYALADAFDTMLREPRDPNLPDRPSLQEFWEQPANHALRNDVARFAESVRFGDPLLIAGKYGKGNVVALLTTAGTAWNDWPNGPARPYFVMVMLETQKYLASVAPDANRTVGSLVEITADPARFEPRMRRIFLPEVLLDAAPGAGPVDQGEQAGTVRGGKLVFTTSDARVPGVYRFDLMAKADGPTPGRIESETYAFNVDTVAEGDLRRANRNELAAAAPGMQLHAPGSGLATILKDRQSDLSESPWFFLLILVALVAEQALAVHLSFHDKRELSVVNSPLSVAKTTDHGPRTTDRRSVASVP